MTLSLVWWYFSYNFAPSGLCLLILNIFENEKKNVRTSSKFKIVMSECLLVVLGLESRYSILTIKPQDTEKERKWQLKFLFNLFVNVKQTLKYSFLPGRGRNWYFLILKILPKMNDFSRFFQLMAI